MSKTTTITAIIVTGAIGLGLAGATFAGPGGGMRGGEHEMPSFETIDANGDGAITPDEMRAMQTAAFADHDTNGDGVLDKDELLAAMTKGAEERAAKMLDRMIAWNDTDGDGALSKDEMPGKERGSMLSRADADGDGSISAEEFEAAQKKMGKGGRGHGKGGRGKGGHGQGGRNGG